MSGLVLWGIPPHGGPAIKITGSDGQGDTLTREMLMRSAQGWEDLVIRRDVATPRERYKQGDHVKAMYQNGGAGTVLGPGVVNAVVKLDDGRKRVTVSTEVGLRYFTLNSRGESDYLLPAD